MLSPSFSVTTPATDLTLLSISELRKAANVADGSRDADLMALGSRVANAITQACNVATDGATPPTLRKETITDTFRRNRFFGRVRNRDRDKLEGGETIYLSRRPIISVASVVEAGTPLDLSSYEIRAGKGALVRLNNDSPIQWVPNKIVVVYDAGWATVPEGLKRAAEQLVQLYWSQNSKDPLVRQSNLPGVLEQQFWMGPPSGPSIPQDVMDDLGPYINLLA
jgi:hypothetical protein